MSFKQFFSYALFFAFILTSTSVFAQRKSGSVFKRANAKMTTAVEKHLAGLASNPYQFKTDLRAGTSGLWTDIYALRKAYDLNPNDLSFKVSNPQNMILILLPLQSPVKANQRLTNDALRDATLRSALTNNENITDWSLQAAFILVRDQLGNFEIQDLMSK